MTMTLSRKLAAFTLRANPDERRSHESLVYQYAVMLNFVSIVLLTLIFGLATGRLTDTLIAAASFTALRMFSGGYHFKSLDVCAIVTAAIYGITPFIPVNDSRITLVITVIVIVAVALLAPTNLRNTLWISSAKVKLTFKCVAVAVVASNFVIGSPIVALAFLAQAVLLIPRREVKPL